MGRVEGSGMLMERRSWYREIAVFNRVVRWVSLTTGQRLEGGEGVRGPGVHLIRKYV